MESTPRKFFKCSECEYSSQISRNLQRHVRVYHGSNPKTPRSYKCTWCDHVSSGAGALRAHVKNHYKHGRVECETPGCVITAGFASDCTAPRRCRIHCLADDKIVDARYMDASGPIGLLRI